MKTRMKLVVCVVLLGCASQPPPYKPDVDLGIMGGFGALASVDLDHDGRLDLVYTIRDNAVVLMNQSTGSGAPAFAPPLELPTRTPGCPDGQGVNCSYGGGLAIADFDGDGRPDIAGTNALAVQGAGTVDVFANLAQGFSPRVELQTGGYYVHSLAAGDLDHDGKPDLVSVGAQCADSTCDLLTVFHNTTTGPGAPLTFDSRVEVRAGAFTPVYAPLRIADLNGDGFGDIVGLFTDIGETTQTLGVLLGTGTGFAAPQMFDETRTELTENGSLVIADFNGDGHLDVAVAHDGTNSMSLLVNTTPPGSMTLGFTATAMTLGLAKLSLQAGDVNGDGAVDLVATSYSSHGDFDDMVAVALNQTPAGNTTPTFATEVDLPAARSNDPDAEGRDWPALGDFDGDGTIDVAIACSVLALDVDIAEKR